VVKEVTETINTGVEYNPSEGKYLFEQTELARHAGIMDEF